MSQSIQIVKHNRGRLQIKSADKSVPDFVRQQFTCLNPNWKHIPYAQKHVSCISPTFTFQPGMALDIINVLRKSRPDVMIDISTVKDLIVPFSYRITRDDLVQPENTDYEYRDYQADAILKGLSTGRGIFEMATSAGKSLIIYGLIKNMWEQLGRKTKVLLLVPNIQLVEQMYKDFIDYGCPPQFVDRFSSKYRSLSDANVIISNRQWLERHKDELPSNIECLIVDECHQLGINSKVSKFVSKFPTHCRFGFTGTLPKYQEAAWWITGLLGKTLKVVPPHELQSQGFIAGTKIVTVRFEHPYKAPESDAECPLQRAKERYPLEWRFIEECHFTNQFMIKMMSRFEGNTILLYDHTEHGDYLHEEANGLGLDKQVFLINGATKVDYREMVREKMEQDNNCFLIGNTKCISTGISIKNIHNIGFCFSSGKSTAKILQSIGRGLRLRGKFEKDHVKLIDFYHNFRYSTDHYSERLALYKENYNIDKVIMKVVPVQGPLNLLHSL